MKNLISKWKTLRRTDRVIIALAVLVAIVCAFFLINDDYLSPFSDEDTSKPLMGVISYKLNDIRHKSSSSMTWINARKKQNIRLGDSVFTGEDSQSQVVLKEGGEVNMGQNSLVVFNKSQLMDLGFGNFGFSVDGDVTISIRGEVTKIKGKNSKIQFIIPKNKNEKPQVRLLSGQATLQIKNKPVMKLVPERVDSLAIFTQTDYKKESGLADIGNMEEYSPRRLQLYDEYELKDSSLSKRHFVSSEIRSLPLIEERASLNLIEENIFDGQGSHFTLQMQGESNFQGYVVEYSRDPQFSHEKTKVSWVPSRRISFALKNPGSVYYRVRGVNEKTEISRYSNTVEAIVPEAQITIGEMEVVKPVKELRVVKVKPVRQVKALKIQKPNKIAKREPRSKKTKADEFISEVFPEEKPSFVERPVSSVVPPPDIQTSLKMEEVNEPTNDLYKNSRLSVETGTFTVFSPDEADVGRTNPFAYMVGIKAKHWLNSKHGFEGIARFKAGNMNDTAKGIDPLQLEARYHYLLAGSWLGRSNMSLIAGFEAYKNIGEGFFAQKYNLGKTGFSLDFPVGRHWDMGGDLLVGLGTDSTRKYEALGRMNYYFRRKYSIGVGYRFNILDAGSEDTAPFDLPYRETYGEGFLVFRWFY
ncbi:MAG: hypothetical protein CL676_02525 [Bdellovibrionaceae bacterium]|nr:hypothetical protein [Pseudobdellovibrionaceae bacterium]